MTQRAYPDSIKLGRRFAAHRQHRSDLRSPGISLRTLPHWTHGLGPGAGRRWRKAVNWWRWRLKGWSRPSTVSATKPKPRSSTHQPVGRGGFSPARASLLTTASLLPHWMCAPLTFLRRHSSRDGVNADASGLRSYRNTSAPSPASGRLPTHRRPQSYWVNTARAWREVLGHGRTLSRRFSSWARRIGNRRQGPSRWFAGSRLGVFGSGHSRPSTRKQKP